MKAGVHLLLVAAVFDATRPGCVHSQTKTVTMVVKAALFDFDGTIADTEKEKQKEIARLCQQAGIDSQQFSFAHGSSDELDLRALADALHWEIDELYGHLTIKAARSALLLPGFQELITCVEHLGIDWGIGSNGYCERISLVFELNGLHLPPTIAIDDLERGNLDGKPAPVIYELLMQELRVSASQVIVLEDSRSGVHGAIASGVAATRIFVIGSSLNGFPDGCRLVQSWTEVIPYLSIL